MPQYSTSYIVTCPSDVNLEAANDIIESCKQLAWTRFILIQMWNIPGYVMVLLCSQEGIFYSKVHITVLVKCRIASYETISKVEEGTEKFWRTINGSRNKA